MLIAGPTASGKSARRSTLAEAAARRGRAPWIVNADAMQVYDGAAHPHRAPEPEPTKCACPHRLYGHVAADTPLFRRRLARRRGAGACRKPRPPARCPICVGGTGLYFKALTEGLAAIPDIPADIRARWAARLESEGVAALHAVLAVRDPRPAAAHPAERSAARAARAGGLGGDRPAARGVAAGAAHVPPLLPPRRRPRSCMEAERATLYRRIEERFDRMVAAGALDEVRALLGARARPALPGHEGDRRQGDFGRASAARFRWRRRSTKAKTRDAALRQAPGHLVPPPDARLAAPQG